MANVKQAEFIKQMDILRAALADSHITVTEEKLERITRRMIEGQEADRITDTAV